MDIRIEGLEELRRKFASLPGRLVAAERRGVEAAALLVLRETVRSGFRGTRGKGARDDTRLTVRSGKLRQSLQASRAQTDAGGLFATVGYRRGVVDQYAGVHEAAGPVTITPKRGRLLAIPVGAALTAGGVPRYASPREVPGFWVTSKAGNKVFLPKDGGPPLFVGKESVTITPRRPLHKAKDRTRDRQVAIIREQINRELAR